MTNPLIAPDSNLTDTHPIFAEALKRTVKKLFASPYEFCAHSGINLKQYEAMFTRSSPALLPSLGVLTSMLFAIKVRSNMAFNALLHNFLEDIEEAWWNYDQEVEEEDEGEGNAEGFTVVAEGPSSNPACGESDETPAPWL